MSTHIDSDGSGNGDDSGNGEGTTRYLRLQVELVMEITDAGRMTSAALDQIAGDEYLPDEERKHARDAVQRDESEALAYLVDPFDLVSGVPGVELVQASWNSAHSEYDPDDEEWDFYEDDDTADDADDDADDAAGDDRAGGTGGAAGGRV
jgi:hypothetical protein